MVIQELTTILPLSSSIRLITRQHSKNVDLPFTCRIAANKYDTPCTDPQAIAGRFRIDEVTNVTGIGFREFVDCSFDRFPNLSRRFVEILECARLPANDHLK